MVFSLGLFQPAIPLCYELTEELRPVNHYFLASDVEVATALAKVEDQGKANVPNKAYPAESKAGGDTKSEKASLFSCCPCIDPANKKKNAQAQLKYT